MTSRGLAEADFQQVAGFLHEALELVKEVQAGSGKLLKDFIVALEGNAKLADIRARVEAFAAAFPMPGFDVASL
jgi:glycine hydroxymethyltransferase